MDRRTFFQLSSVPLLGIFASPDLRAASGSLNLADVDRTRILKAANACLSEPPVTITSFKSPRSAGGPHDYFSEGDYWWPDPGNTSGPYIQRDGMTNPDNFIAHRHAVMQLSLGVPALAAAWSITKNERYSAHAIRHLNAWFIDSATMMNPNLQFAQAIKGRSTGRGIGIIDTIHLVEVARAAGVLEGSRALTPSVRDAIQRWFSDYLSWMTTHPNGIEEREAKNNHGTCWVMQVAQFATYTRNAKLVQYCRDRYKSVLLPNQVATDGSFPLELRRTKPYGYSLFNLEAMTAVCQILSTKEENLWSFKLPDGRGMDKAVAFMFPYIKDKKKWPFASDVMYFDQWPVRQTSLLFGGHALGKPEYIALWKGLNPDPSVEEVIRNFPIRQPVLWISEL